MTISNGDIQNAIKSSTTVHQYHHQYSTATQESRLLVVRYCTHRRVANLCMAPGSKTKILRSPGDIEAPISVRLRKSEHRRNPSNFLFGFSGGSLAIASRTESRSMPVPLHPEFPLRLLCRSRIYRVVFPSLAVYSSSTDG